MDNLTQQTPEKAKTEVSADDSGAPAFTTCNKCSIVFIDMAEASDVMLPTDSTGCPCVLVLVQDFDMTHMGQTDNLACENVA